MHTFRPIPTPMRLSPVCVRFIFRQPAIRKWRLFPSEPGQTVSRRRLAIFLQELSYIKPVWIELGLQTIHEDTARRIRRGYPLSVFEEALGILSERNIPVIVHTILGLPGESQRTWNLQPVIWPASPSRALSPSFFMCFKTQDLAELYEKQPFHILTLEEYTDLLIRCIEVLPPNIVIHRITGTVPKAFS